MNFELAYTLTTRLALAPVSMPAILIRLPCGDNCGDSNLCWAFALSNAGSWCFEDKASLHCLAEVNWKGAKATKWSGDSVSRQLKEDK